MVWTWVSLRLRKLYKSKIAINSLFNFGRSNMYHIYSKLYFLWQVLLFWTFLFFFFSFGEELLSNLHFWFHYYDPSVCHTGQETKNVITGLCIVTVFFVPIMLENFISLFYIFTFMADMYTIMLNLTVIFCSAKCCHFTHIFSEPTSNNIIGRSWSLSMGSLILFTEICLNVLYKTVMRFNENRISIL